MTRTLPPRISLVLSDVDGTLITPDKQITPDAEAAVAELRQRGIRFAVASSRPTRGLGFIAEQLQLDAPLSGFNGGLIRWPDGAIVESLPLPEAAGMPIVTLLQDMGLSIWVFAGDDWYITDPTGPRVDHEETSIRYAPTVVDEFDANMVARAIKIVGVSMDYPLVEAAEHATMARFGDQVSATRSQPFYLDITHSAATKGRVVHHLSRLYGISTNEIVTIGDGENDTLMFAESGYSFAMGNGAPEVQAAASAVTATNREEGFAKAMRLVLNGLGAA